MSITSWTTNDLIEGDQAVGRDFDFELRKQWIEQIIEDLEKYLKLFFSVISAIQNLHVDREQTEAWSEISRLMNLDVDDLIDRLRHMHKKLKLTTYELPENYIPILQAVQTLRHRTPIKKEFLLPYNRRRSRDEQLQWISGTLANKARIRTLNKRITSMQAAIDELQLKSFALFDRSRREIQEIVEESQLELAEVKQSGDNEFVRMQEELSTKVLDLEQCGEYRDLVEDHSMKRRKITKLTVQLQLWIKKYDKFVGEPMKESKELEGEVKKFEQWKETVYEPQLEKYNQLKARVEQLESEIIDEQVERFRKEHAARVIQRRWRALRQKLKSKKKSKRRGKKRAKGKKKKSK